jgi:hypothetical protein
MDARDKLATLLDQVASGYLPVRDALRQIHSGEWDAPELWNTDSDDDICKLLEQIEIDEDLRAHDAEHAARQDRKLRDAAERLRNASREARAREIAVTPLRRLASAIADRVLLVATAIVVIAGVLALSVFQSHLVRRWPLNDNSTELFLITVMVFLVVAWAGSSIGRRLRPPY